MVRTPDGALPLIALTLFCSLFMTTWSMDRQPEAMAGSRPVSADVMQADSRSSKKMQSPAATDLTVSDQVRIIVERPIIETDGKSRVVEMANLSGDLLPGEYVIMIDGVRRGRMTVDPQAPFNITGSRETSSRR